MDIDKHIRSRKQQVLVKGYPVTVKYILDNLEDFWDHRKMSRMPGFLLVVIPFFQEVHDGKTFTNEELINHPYFDYVLGSYPESRRSSSRSRRHSLNIVRDSIKLYARIKEEKFRAPIDAWIAKDKLNLYRGSRRLAIAYVLGHRNMSIRIFQSAEVMEKILPSKKCRIDDSIHGLAIKQFTKLGYNATDKYWTHSYTELYDRHIGPLRNTATKFLEIGVKRGASLLLWKDAFINAHIYGIDMNISGACYVKDTPRIHLFEGLQEDEGFLRKEIVPLGKFDVIIDDANHRSPQQIGSFKVLWNSVKSDGFYIIEDLAFHNFKGGKSVMVDTLKNMIGEMNLTASIKGMHFYYNICFIQKR